MGLRSLGMRVSLVVLLPLVALQAFSIDNVRNQLRTERSSQNVVEAVSLINDVGRIFAPATLEQIGSDGLAQVDTFQIDRLVIADLTGIDLESRVRAVRVELDTALDRLA